ncbi:MAG: dUTP diphosphatase [Arenicellaceae bacterium]|nr:dUTP diphosphatase [Arenicellaceae bacterium]
MSQEIVESVMEPLVDTMLEMQEQMNQKVNTDWRNQSYGWYRAIWVECAELMDHYGWKWWKRQSPDLEQIKLELVDIWHFGLSLMLVEARGNLGLSNIIVKEFSEPRHYDDFLTAVEAFTTEVLQERKFSVASFAGLAKLMDMDMSDLHRRYVAKNVLNFFRQDNGYKDGSYRKLWGGREDNEHLVEVLAGVDSQASDFRDQLYNALKQRYQRFTD